VKLKRAIYGEVASGTNRLSTCEEGLCEVETRHPEGTWSTIVNPVLEEGKSGKQTRNTNSVIQYHPTHTPVTPAHPQSIPLASKYLGR